MKRHLLIPDAQVKPGAPTEHINWAANAIVEYKPDVLIVIGDFWDFPSLNGHAEPGSVELENSRYKRDLEVGNEAFNRLCYPMEREQKRLEDGKRKRWNCRKIFTRGNHEDRADRLARNYPKFEGVIGSHNCDTRDFEVYPFLEIVEVDGISYSHYFANTHSGRPIGGTIPNRLNKIGRSFVCGHEQGLLYGRQPYPGKLARHGLVAGSFYLHNETYRGPQGRDEWRGIVVMNEVQDGQFDVMPLSMNFLQRRFG
jgi:hypothetical protein